MRESLVKAGILEENSSGEDDCMFVLEPEAASAFCLAKGKSLGLPKFEDGLVFMIVDAGGGTVDITVHKVENQKLKEVTVRSGDVCGSTIIDDKFFEWLSKNFVTIDDLFQKDPLSHLQMRARWESFKLSSKSFDQRGLIEAPEALKALIDSGKLKPSSPDIYRRGTISLSPQEQKSIFEGALNRISTMVAGQLDQSVAVKFILLVGGFGQSPHLLKMLKEKFAPENGNGKVENVFRASDSHLAVVSGGVVLGLDPSLIRTRRANQSCIL